MDGYNVNFSFQQKLANSINENSNEFLDIGNCSLHNVYSAFKNALKEISI